MDGFVGALPVRDGFCAVSGLLPKGLGAYKSQGISL